MMVNGALFSNQDEDLLILDSNGSLYKCQVLEGNCLINENLPQKFKFLSGCKHSTWAVDNDNRVFIFVYSKLSPIRKKVVTYENQRWLPHNGYSSSNLFPTDRPNFSDKSGKYSLPKNDFNLLTSNWSWKNDWFISTELDGQPLGPEGWTYAMDFPLSYSIEQQWNTCVRRRKWIRFMEYSFINKWALINDENNIQVQKISIGAYDIPNCCKLALWAIDIENKLIFRKGITLNHLEGESWINIEMPVDKIVEVSVSPLGLVWIISSDGLIFVRLGVTNESLEGDSWMCISPPTNELILQLSVGTHSIWAISREKNVWFRKGMYSNSERNEKELFGSGWVKATMQMSFITVTFNNQVWAIDLSGSVIYQRIGISLQEPCGKQWIKILTYPNSCTALINDDPIESKSESANDYNPSNEQKWISLCSSPSNPSSYFYSENNIAKWSKPILELLEIRFNKEMKDFQKQFPIFSESKLENWPKTIICDIYINKKCSWVHCALIPNKDNSEAINSLSIQTNDNKIIMTLDFLDIRCVTIQLSYCLNIKHTLIIHGSFMPQPLKLMFNDESQINEWFHSFHFYCPQIRYVKGLFDQNNSIWCLSNNGYVYLTQSNFNCGSIPNPITENFFHYFSEGHFEILESCKDGITWAISRDNHVYVYNGNYLDKTLEATRFCPFYDTLTVTTYENQRWFPFIGWSSQLLPTDRYQWSNKKGLNELKKENFRLPSNQWEWSSDWSIDYLVHGGVDKEGWQYSIDFSRPFYKNYNTASFVRRRKWFRNAKLSILIPWSKIGSTTLSSISLFSSEKIHVWGATVVGDVLCRTHVSLKNPAGKDWKYIECEQAIKHISISGKDGQLFVWAVSKDGSAYLRIGVSDEIPFGTSWYHIEPNTNFSLRKIYSTPSAVYAIDDNKRLIQRTGIHLAFPAGTDWLRVTNNNYKFINICVDSNNIIWAIVKKDSNTFLAQANSNKIREKLQFEISTLSDFKYLSSC